MKRCAIHCALYAGRALHVITGNKIYIHIVDSCIDIRMLGIFFMEPVSKRSCNAASERQALLFKLFAGEERIKKHENIEIAVAFHQGVPGDGPDYHPSCPPTRA